MVACPGVGAVVVVVVDAVDVVVDAVEVVVRAVFHAAGLMHATSTCPPNRLS